MNVNAGFIVKCYTTPHDLRAIAEMMENLAECAKWGDDLCVYRWESDQYTIRFILDLERWRESGNGKC